MLKTLTHARLDHSYEAELRKLVAVDLLILDDFSIDVLDPVESRDFYDLLIERYRTGSVIVTSNRGPDEWLVTFADPVRAQSAIDRFTSNAYDLVIGRILPTATQTAARQGGEGALATRPTACPASRGGTRRQLSSSIGAPATAAECLQALLRPLHEAKVETDYARLEHHHAA